MSDVTHYARARKWLDDPATVVPDDVRASIDATLAISTAQRETDKSIARLCVRIDAFTDAFVGVLCALAPKAMIDIAGIMINPASVTHIDRDSDGWSRVHAGGDVLLVTAKDSPAELAARLGL